MRKQFHWWAQCRQVLTSVFWAALTTMCLTGVTAMPAGENNAVALTGPDSPLRFGDRIVFHGDSITAQSSGTEGFTTLFQRDFASRCPDLRVRVSAAGESGRKAASLASSLSHEVLDQEPTVVFIFIGVNDVWQHDSRFGGKGGSPEAYAAALRAEIDAVQQAGALPVLATPAVIGERTDGHNDMRLAMTTTPPATGDPVLADALLDQYADLSRTVATEKGIVLCDLRTAFLEYLKAHNPDQQVQEILTVDGVHLSPAGNRLVASQAAQSIAAALRARPWFLPLHDAVVTPGTRVTLQGRTGDDAGLDIHYTLDGSEPTAAAARYRAPLILQATTTLRISVADPHGQRFTSRATYTVTPLRPPDAMKNVASGLQYALYDLKSETKLAPDLTGRPPVQTGPWANPFFIPPQGVTNYAARLTGYLAIPTDGVYSFTARSVFGSQLWIGDRLVTTHDYVGMKVSRTGEIALAAGRHAFTIDFYREAGRDQSQWFFITGPGLPYQMIPDGMWQHPIATGPGAISSQ